MSDKIDYTPASRAGLLTTTQDQGQARHLLFPIYEALVEEVILDHSDGAFDGYNIGAIKVRIIGVDPIVDEEKLQWANPYDATIQEVPLRGELVILHKIRNEFFYIKKLAVAHRLQENAFLNTNTILQSQGSNPSKEKIQEGDELSIQGHVFGKYFKPDSRIRKLKHFEGDVIFQGRMGHSIRFGSSKMDPSTEGMAPNIILRAGQAYEAEIMEDNTVSAKTQFGVILEDVNKDVSSIWMTTDQTVPFLPITHKLGSFNRSVTNPIQQYDGANIIVNSDRIVLNSKNSHILMFSNDGIHMNSFNDTTVDSNKSIILTANLDLTTKVSRDNISISDRDHVIKSGKDLQSIVIKNTSFISDKIFIGSASDGREPVVAGTSLSTFLGRLILAILGSPGQTGNQQDDTDDLPNLPPVATPGIYTTAHVVTALGPGLLSTAIVGELVKLYNELKRNDFSGAPFNSRNNFVVLHNEEPNVVLNEFKDGERQVIQNNEWKLTEPYYRVE